MSLRLDRDFERRSGCCRRVRSRLRRLFAVLGALIVSSIPASAQAQTTRAIQARAFVGPDGELHPNGLIVIADGLITQVGGEAPAGVAVDAYDGAVVSPGLIEVSAALGASGNLSETQHALQPNADARDAFDRYHRQMRAALLAGVTTFALVPDDRNLVGGRIAICQTAGPDGAPRILDEAGPLKLSLSPAVFEGEREPTSRTGAVGMLRTAFEKARARKDADDTIAALVRGELPAIMTTPSGADVLVAIDLAKSFGLKLTLRHNNDVRAIAPALASSGVSVIVGPYDLYSSRRAATAAGLLERAGVPVAIVGGLPHRPADSLRTGAAIAARNGMSLAAARKAITIVPATMLGVGERVGSIQQGRQADLVVFSGDPLDLRSRVLAVYVQGRRVYVAGNEAGREK